MMFLPLLYPNSSNAFNLSNNRSVPYCMWPFPYEIPHPPWSPHPHPPQAHQGGGQGGYPLPPYPPISQPYWSPQLNSSVNEKSFSPWQPGDAYSTEEEPLSPYWMGPYGPYSPYGPWRAGEQIREYDHKTRRWYYHSIPGFFQYLIDLNF
ncbi:uncharacterized protein LOC111703022 [Eurytemora carolleeae]|uniref:uncharacterized protein LOC111703022 n=1 Tax=Eurytemora carolleeae TaxID=1294199 RepID=UPI000C786BE3|nr:uncharacterized protein LOC111703022 [Eurytemora carolleeae]|eukprot:XP_023330632.1 uncharacterized protein LOC111703022 [Eurytemora affinis]